MRLELTTAMSVRQAGYQRTKLQVVLDNFIDSDASAAKVILDPGEYTSVTSAYQALYQAIKRNQYIIHVRMIKGIIYLLKHGF